MIILFDPFLSIIVPRPGLKDLISKAQVFCRLPRKSQFGQKRERERKKQKCYQYHLSSTRDNTPHTRVLWIHHKHNKNEKSMVRTRSKRRSPTTAASGTNHHHSQASSSSTSASNLTDPNGSTPSVESSSSSSSSLADRDPHSRTNAPPPKRRKDNDNNDNQEETNRTESRALVASRRHSEPVPRPSHTDPRSQKNPSPRQQDWSTWPLQQVLDASFLRDSVGKVRNVSHDCGKTRTEPGPHCVLTILFCCYLVSCLPNDMDDASCYTILSITTRRTCFNAFAICCGIWRLCRRKTRTGTTTPSSIPVNNGLDWPDWRSTWWTICCTIRPMPRCGCGRRRLWWNSWPGRRPKRPGRRTN